MSRLLLLTGLSGVLGVVVMMPAGAPAQPQPAPVKPEEELVNKVRDSIKRGVAYLKKNQTSQGNWEGVVLKFLADMEGGSTALVVLALLNCGEKPDEPYLQKAIKYLADLPPRKTYVVGLQNMVFAEVREKKYLPIIQRNADWLIKGAVGYREGAGALQGWTYQPSGNNTLGDNSNTQYALLGLYAAKSAGAKIEDKHWKAIQDYYQRTQHKSGYWKYHNRLDTGASFTMTVAGVCGLLIAGMGLDQSSQQLDPATGVAANCGVYDENEPVARGMNWIASRFNFEQGLTPFEQGSSIAYNIYGIERLGRLSGQRFIGKYDWYREGCKYLLGKQRGDGHFAVGAAPLDASEVLSTAFSLLFLSKGRTPVLISKFAWGGLVGRGNTASEARIGPKGQVDWNRKHNDTRHLVEFASHELFKGAPLAWQVYDMRRLNIDDDHKMLDEVSVLLQTPVLYLNGHGAMPFVGLPGSLLTIQEKLLQKYVEEGGFILAEACCGDEEFADSFRALMKRIFPRNELRRLPASHVIWTTFFKDAGLAQFAGLEGLEKGCRTVVVFSPKPLAGYWEEQKYMPLTGQVPARKGDDRYRGEVAYKLAGNVIAYATGLELPKPKLSRTAIFDPNAADRGPTRGLFKVAQIIPNGGDAEPAPAAMRNLMAHVREKTHLDVAIKTEKPVYFGDDTLFNFKFMYLHGRKPFTLSDVDVENLKSNLQTGGLLFVDAGCNGFDAWKKFDASFRAECKKLFPKNPLQVIPANDPLLSAKTNGGTALTSVRCRREAADSQGPEAEMRNYATYLEGVKLDGRWAIVYSKYDVGCALEGHKAADCLGHDKESAMRIGSAVVLYSLKR
ncbi:MAG TPA: DUF4159 domain-containing protein [Urbifossiella sp.]|nr:DUF4159 domain-containing protein [Urbifossiella sp.]